VRHYDDAQAVGRRLRQARENAGLSQRQLAFTGCSPAYLSRIEAGDRAPSLQLLRELARRLNVTEDYLAYGRDATTTDPLLPAELALRMDDLDTAEELFRAELDSENSGLRARALEGLGQLAFRNGDAADAIFLLEQAAALYKDELPVRQALVETLARAYSLIGDSESAIALLERSLKAAENRGDLLEEVRFRILLSYALADAGQLARASEFLSAALTHADELADPQARVRLYWAQCRLHLQRDQPELAERYGRKVIELLELTEDSYHLARGYRLMASVAFDQGQAEESLTFLESARHVLGDSGNAAELASIDLAESRALARLGQPERAADLARSAWDVLNDRPEEAGYSYLLVGKALAEAGDRTSALELVELACELLERTPSRFLVDAYSELAALLEADGRKDEAYEILKKAVDVRSRIATT
jgi:tetratricopeptide (TPR) repeat protein